jgi:hypothetical protein
MLVIRRREIWFGQVCWVEVTIVAAVSSEG